MSIFKTRCIFKAEYAPLATCVGVLKIATSSDRGLHTEVVGRCLRNTLLGSLLCEGLPQGTPFRLLRKTVIKNNDDAFFLLLALRSA